MTTPRAGGPSAAASHSVDPPSRVVAVFAVVVLVISTGAFFPLSPALQTLVLPLWFLSYGLAAVGIADTLLRQRHRPGLPLFLFGFVGLALLSTTWSVAPGVSLRRGVALFGTVLVGLFLAQRLRPLDLFQAIRRAALIVALASLVLFLAGDARALDEVHQTLRGVLSTKNTLARVMAIGLIASATEVMLDRARWRWCLASAVPFGVALLLTDSAGGLIVAVVGVVGVAVIAMWRADRGKSGVPALLFGALGLLVLLVPAGLSANSVLALAGRDASLTGRTDIWAQSLQAAAERPWTGAGFGAFWGVGSSQDSPAASRISARLAEPVANAHNGFLDVALDLGLPGVTLAALTMISILLTGVRDVRGGRAEQGVLRLGIGVLVLVSTAAEGGLLKENGLLTVLIAIAASRGDTGPGVAPPPHQKASARRVVSPDPPPRLIGSGVP